MRKGERGFAMVDTLVALMIAAIAGAALMSAQRLTLKGSSNAETRLNAIAIAQSKLSTETGSVIGETNLKQQTFRWAVRTQLPTPEMLNQRAKLLEKSVTVEWGEDADAAQSLTLTTYIIN
jgi:Tfp pilus assembly protein PilV